MSAPRRTAIRRDPAEVASDGPRPAAVARPRPTAAPRPEPPARPATAPRPARPAKAEPQRSSIFIERTRRIRQLYYDTRAEVKKISWPDRETTRNLTIVVIGISVVLGLLLGGMDYVLFKIFSLLP